MAKGIATRAVDLEPIDRLEEKVKAWLRARISEIENERAANAERIY